MAAKRRHLRADAARNRAAILSAAEELLGVEGPSLSTQAVAQRASVGIGTLFRHFPTKEDLLRAVVAARVERLTKRADEAKAEGTHGLFRFFEAVVEHTVSTPAIYHALLALGVDPQAAVSKARAEFLGALNDLLSHAQAEGAVRNDVSVTDVYDLLVAVVHATERCGRNPRALAVVLDGLRRR